MPAIVVGGHSRKVGKTSVIEGMIRALPQQRWTAVKISAHWHGDPSDPAALVVQEEFPGKTVDSDTARYLAAGAARAFWIQVRPQRFAEAVPALLPILHSSPFVIIESNAIVHYVRPDLFVMVLRCDVDEFKESARGILARADAIVMIDSGTSPPSWQEGVRVATAGIPTFCTREAGSLPADLPGFIQSGLSG